MNSMCAFITLLLYIYSSKTYSEDKHEELLFSDSVSPVLELLEAVETCERTDVPLLY